MNESKNGSLLNFQANSLTSSQSQISEFVWKFRWKTVGGSSEGQKEMFRRYRASKGLFCPPNYLICPAINFSLVMALRRWSIDTKNEFGLLTS